MSLWDFFGPKRASDLAGGLAAQEESKELEDYLTVISKLQTAFRRSEEALHDATAKLTAATEKIATLEKSSEALKEPSPALAELWLRLRDWTDENKDAGELLGFLAEDQVMPASLESFGDRCLELLLRCGGAAARLLREGREQGDEAKEASINFAMDAAKEEAEAEKLALPAAKSCSAGTTPTCGEEEIPFEGCSSGDLPFLQDMTDAHGEEMQPCRLNLDEPTVPRCSHVVSVLQNNMMEANASINGDQAAGATVPPHRGEEKPVAAVRARPGKRKFQTWVRDRREAKRPSKDLRRTQLPLNEIRKQKMAALCQLEVERERAERAHADSARIAETLLQIRKEISRILTCPITQQMLEGPVMTPDGRTYDRLAISHWTLRQATCPFTRSELTLAMLRRNRLADELLLMWRRFWPRDAAGLPPAVQMSPDSVSYTFFRAIEEHQSSLALECLSRPMHRESFTLGYLIAGHTMPLLHFVLCHGLEDVALAVLRRDDYPHTWHYSEQLVMAIHIAAFRGFAQVCRALIGLQSGAPRWKTRAGAFILLNGVKHRLWCRSTPIELARQQGHGTLANWLATSQ